MQAHQAKVAEGAGVVATSGAENADDEMITMPDWVREGLPEDMRTKQSPQKERSGGRFNNGTV